MTEKKVLTPSSAKKETIKKIAATKKETNKKGKKKNAVAKRRAIPANKGRPARAKKAIKIKSELTNYANMLKKQEELEQAKKLAKNELRKEYEYFLLKADSIKEKYKRLFSESIDARPRKSGTRRSKKGTKQGKAKRGYTLEQIKSFLTQKDAGEKITIEGKNSAGIARIRSAYDKSAAKDAKSILELINKGN